MEEQKDLLQDLEFEAGHQRVRWGLRLGNYIIDLIAIRGCIYFLTKLIISVNAEGYYNFFTGFNRFEFYCINYLYSAVVILLYYTIMEGGMKGRTIGKLITNTQVVMYDGKPITWQAALLRSLNRLVPFEPFSAFNGYPWHDSWTHTEVVRARRWN